MIHSEIFSFFFVEGAVIVVSHFDGSVFDFVEEVDAAEFLGESEESDVVFRSQIVAWSVVEEIEADDGRIGRISDNLAVVFALNI